jgi:hypothetical protein
MYLLDLQLQMLFVHWVELNNLSVCSWEIMLKFTIIVEIQANIQ